MLGEHLWLVLHHSQASSILVFDLLQDHEREKMAIQPHDAMESLEIMKVANLGPACPQESRPPKL